MTNFIEIQALNCFALINKEHIASVIYTHNNPCGLKIVYIVPTHSDLALENEFKFEEAVEAFNAYNKFKLNLIY